MEHKMINNTPNINHPKKSGSDSGAVSPLIIIRIAVCAVIIAIGFAGFKYLIHSAPEAKKKPPAKISPLVRIQPLFPETVSTVIPAMGSVIPAREVTLRSRVAGEIISVHPEFIDGGFIKKGDEILQIDDADYKLAVIRKKSDVTEARYLLKLEQGHQAVAKREWALLSNGKPSATMESDLALRKPHLEKAESDLAAAEADLNQALLDLERTSIIAPFNLIIRSKNVEIGSQVASQSSLADVVDIDEYWVRVSVSADRLAWIDIPLDQTSSGAEALIKYRNGEVTNGSVIKLLSDLEPEGKMARLLISIKDPLGISHHENTSRKNSGPPLLIGEYVKSDINGRQIEDAFRIPRTALRDNSHIWLAGADNKLEIRPVKTIWRDKDMVIVKDNLLPGDRLIISELATPVEGMPLSIENNDEPNE
jgi:RND family efflux transporter MFP subunit